MSGKSRYVGKNHWALFMLILLGIVVGSFIGYLTKEVPVLKYLNYSFGLSIGDSKEGGTLTLNLLSAVVISFGLKIKISIWSVIGAIASVIIYKKI